MREVVIEFETPKQGANDEYGDEGCRLTDLIGCPLVLRHERYTDEAHDTIYLFARQPELGAQIYLEVFPGVGVDAGWLKSVSFYEEQQADFRLPSGQKFGDTFLAPVAHGFISHRAFRTRDGRTRRRIVHVFEGAQRRVLLVYSLDSSDFAGSRFCSVVSSGLRLADVALAEPFCPSTHYN